MAKLVLILNAIIWVPVMAALMVVGKVISEVNKVLSFVLRIVFLPLNLLLMPIYKRIAAKKAAESTVVDTTEVK